jgi:hypothetical protein
VRYAIIALCNIESNALVKMSASGEDRIDVTHLADSAGVGRGRLCRS